MLALKFGQINGYTLVKVSKSALGIIVGDSGCTYLETRDNFTTFIDYIYKKKCHSSEMRGLCLMKLPSEILQNLPYFWNRLFVFLNYARSFDQA